MKECGVNKVDEWNQLPPIQHSIQSSQYVEIPCYTSLPRDDQAALEFRLDKTDTAVDPSSMFLHLHLQIADENGKPMLGPTDKQVKEYNEKKKTDKNAKLDDKRPSADNLLAYSLFSSVDVFISDQKINPGSAYYPWMCYVLNLLYQSAEAKETSLREAGWYGDSAALFDTIAGLSQGYKDRFHMLYDGDKCELIAKVMLDTVFPAWVLPVQTEFTLRFNRSNPNLCLMAKQGTFRIKIESAKLYALKLRLSDQALQRQSDMLASEGVSYPMLRYTMRTMTMMKGAQNLDWVPVSGVMPRKIYIWQMKQEAFNGKLDKNPFNFELFGLAKLQVLVNEQSMITSQPTQLTLDNSAMAYMNTILNTTEAPFSHFQFSYGYGVNVVDLTRDRSAGCNYASEPITGNMRILMDYSDPLNESVVVFCMAEYNSFLHLDTNRNPTWT